MPRKPRRSDVGKAPGHPTLQLIAQYQTIQLRDQDVIMRGKPLVELHALQERVIAIQTSKIMVGKSLAGLRATRYFLKRK
jgi:hypothetical protein